MKYSELPQRYWTQQENGKWSSIARSNIDARIPKVQTVQTNKTNEQLWDDQQWLPAQDLPVLPA